MKNIKSALLFSFVMLLSYTLEAQTNDIRYTQEDVEIYNNVVNSVKELRDSSISKITTTVATKFLNTIYLAGTLEKIPEELTINLRATDCILFVEMCTAIALNVKNYDNPHFSQYCDQVRNLRYRDGVVNGYDSRLHYTSEWILQNQKNGIMEEITSKYGKVFDQEFSYMSTHPSSYTQLRNSDDMVRRIANIEERLNTSGPYYYISQDKLREIEKEIKNGDIVCFISPVKGLDISHVAIAYWNKKNELHFIHASLREMKVVVEKKKLTDYATNGIRLIRLKY